MALVGVALTLVLFSIAVASGRQAHEAEREIVGRDIAHRVVEIFDLAEVRLDGIEGFFRASEFVTASEFDAFVDELGLIDGMSGVGYIDTVNPGVLGPFVLNARSEYGEYRPFGLDDSMERVPVPLDATLHLLVYAVPRDGFGGMLGLDFGSLPAVVSTLETARATSSDGATPLFDVEGGPDRRDFLLVTPIGGGDGGFAAALMDLDTLVESSVPDHAEGVFEVTVDQIASAAVPREPNEWRTVVFHGGAAWQVTVANTSPFRIWAPGRIAWLVVGLVVSFGAATMVRLAAVNVRIRREARATALAVEQTDRLLSSVSHELRTPLTAIVGFLAELARSWDEIPRDDRLEMISIAESSAEDMAGMISDLLMRERILSGTPLRVDLHQIDVGEVVRDVVARLDHCEIEIAGRDGVSAIADPQHLRHAVRALTVAASGDEREQVLVTLRVESQRVRLEFTGRPFDACCVAEFFSIGSSCRLHGSTITADIGPAVARYLARSMGGDVYYDIEGGGFVLELERRAATDGLRVA